MNQKPTCRFLAEWLHARNPMVAYAALAMACDARTLHDACVLAKSQELNEQFSRELMKSWMTNQLYRKHNEIYAEAIGFFTPGTSPEHDELVQHGIAYLAMKEFSHLSPQEQNDSFLDRFWHTRSGRSRIIKNINKRGKFWLSKYKGKIRSLLQSMRNGFTAPQGNPEEFLQTSHGSFFVRVITPCWIETGIQYSIIHRAARIGNPVGIQCALRYNPVALFDDSISAHFMHACQFNRELFLEYKKALDDGVTAKVPSPDKIKAFVAINIRNMSLGFQKMSDGFRGFLSTLRIKFNKNKRVKLSVKDTYDLYHAISCYASGGDSVFDPDLPDTDNTYAKIVQRVGTSMDNMRRALGLDPNPYKL